jgi:hypothetical protein
MPLDTPSVRDVKRVVHLKIASMIETVSLRVWFRVETVNAKLSVLSSHLDAHGIEDEEAISYSSFPDSWVLYYPTPQGYVVLL